jgi:hypothetical protein
MPAPLKEALDLHRQLTLPVEDKRAQPGYRWTGGARWFRTSNVVDLQRYRSPEDLRRMIDLAHARWLNQWDGGRTWPP